MGSFLTTAQRTMAPTYVHGGQCWPLAGKVSPCEIACPLQMDIPNYLLAIARGNFEEALNIVRETNPLPSTCGRVCHHPCEGKCNRGVVDSPVAIMWLKRFVADRGQNGKPPQVKGTKERVAIVGAGPAGLTAAHDLVTQGYRVVLFEASSRPGGLLSSAIPEFILPWEAVKRDVEYLEALGVRIHTGVRLGEDFGLEDLLDQGFKAVLIAVGTQKSVMLKMPGSDLPGVFPALEWLKQVKGQAIRSVHGKVWIIGGGGVALDVARTAIRLGAKEANVACLESRRDMPAFAWEIDAAEREGVRFHPSLAPQAFQSRKGAGVDEIRFKRVRSTQKTPDGRITWILEEGPGSDFVAQGDAVFIAVGQTPDEEVVGGEKWVRKDSGLIRVNPQTLETNLSGVFSAGDISGTGGTVTDAMAAGRRAARSIELFLTGGMPKEAPPAPEAVSIKPEQIPDYFVRKERWEMPRLNGRQARSNFREIDLGYQEWQAVEEAGRCLNCRMCANCMFDRGQMCYETGTRLLGSGGF
jgi:NADPH-dependent glutamate synthase beta subunit-like oxidoreductase